MSSVLSSNRSTGFTNTPACKLVFCGVFAAYAVANAPIWPYTHSSVFSALHQRDIGQPWWLLRVVTSRLVFSDLSQLIFGAVLIYNFRIFERLCGTRQFASQLAITWLISTAVELLLLVLLPRLSSSWHPDTLQLSPGPYGLILPLSVDFWREVPSVHSSRVCGVWLSDKWLTYATAFQFCSVLSSSLVPAVSCILAGLFYSNNVLGIQQLRWPGCMCSWLGEPLARLLQPFGSTTAADDRRLLGATLEVQRQQRMDAWEQMEAAILARTQTAGRDIADERVQGPQASANSVVAAENCVRQLMEMGFSRERSELALRSTNNDIHLATNLLLQQ